MSGSWLCNETMRRVPSGPLRSALERQRRIPHNLDSYNSKSRPVLFGHCSPCRSRAVPRVRHAVSGVAFLACLFPVLGCGSAHWIRNGWLDPTQVGQFEEPRRNEIRESLSILEEPEGILNAEEPRAADLVPDYEALKIGPGDALNVSIFELTTPGMVSVQQIRVGNSGFVTFPLIESVRVAGLTARELELELKRRLREADILDDADVQVSMLQSQAAQFSIVGNVLRPGTYPLPGPVHRLLAALASAGGASLTSETVLVFRGQASRAEHDVLETGRPIRGEWGAQQAVAYTMSDVSSGPARVEPPSGTTRPTTRESRRGELDVLERAPKTPDRAAEPRWDARLDRWVIGDAETQPGGAGEAAGRPRLPGETQATRGAPAGGQEGAAAGADRPWDDRDELMPAMRIIEVPVKELMEGDPQYNIVVRPYDVIHVPPGNVGEFYMMGNVMRPGAYSLTGRRMTVKEAIASAGGFGPLAWPARANLVRRLSKEEEQIIQLDLDAIFAGDAPDFYLKPNDIVDVGTSPAAMFFAVLRNAFRFTYGMGFVYDRNFADSDTFVAREQVKARRRNEALQRGIPF